MAGLTITAPEGLPYLDYHRDFDAAPDAVFRAHGDRDVYARWMGSDGEPLTIEEWEFSSLGRYRWASHDPEGANVFRGTFHTVRPGFIIQTFEFEGMPDAVSLETSVFEPLDGGSRTRLRVHCVYSAIEMRDGMLGPEMDGGIAAVYDRLEALLAG